MIFEILKQIIWVLMLHTQADIKNYFFLKDMKISMRFDFSCLKVSHLFMLCFLETIILRLTFSLIY